MTVERALARSINTVAVKVAKRVGPEKIVSAARRLGITAKLSPDLSLALGASEVSLFEMTAAYLPFANGGTGVFPYGVAEIRTSRGAVLYRRSGDSLGRIVDARDVGWMNRMLSAAVKDGTGRHARLEGREVAGKTGTSQDFRDGWFYRLLLTLSPAFGSGTMTNRPTKKVAGGQLPATIWRDFAARATHGHTAEALPRYKAPTTQGRQQAIVARRDHDFFSRIGASRGAGSTNRAAQPGKQ